jgi:hypothetical protein
MQFLVGFVPLDYQRFAGAPKELGGKLPGNGVLTKFNPPSPLAFGELAQSGLCGKLRPDNRRWLSRFVSSVWPLPELVFVEVLCGLSASIAKKS